MVEEQGVDQKVKETQDEIDKRIAANEAAAD
jgi:hypothetical protein